MRVLSIVKCHVRTRTRAQALVEMALVVPLLIILLIGVFEFGLVLYAHVQVSNAAREAARAASLYRSQRYSTIDPTKADTVKCSGTITGWTLDQTIKQAIVYYKTDTNGCPGTSAIDHTSLGWLETKPTPTDWQMTLTPSQSGGAMPDAGTSATITLRYPYKLVVLSNFISYLSDPIWIEKSVKIEYQN